MPDRMIRNVDQEVYDRFRGMAKARLIPQADLLARLLVLWEYCAEYDTPALEHAQLTPIVS